MGQYVGIDLHRRSTTIVRMAEDGEVLGTERFVSQPFELAQAMAVAGPEPEVVLESTYGWYWAADVLQELGAHVHLAHALGNNWGNRRVKNDVRDAQDLAAMLALGRLAEGWIAPPAVRELRELVRYRYSLIRHRTSAKAQIHGVMAKNGILPVVGELWGSDRSGPTRPPRTPRGLRHAPRFLAPPDVYEAAIAELDAHIHAQLKADPGYRALLTLPGVGKIIAAIFVAEIGDIGRFDSAKKLCSWAGLTPKHRESRGVLEEDAPLAAGVKRQASGGHRPTLTPTSRWRALSCRTPTGGLGTIDEKRLLIRLRPFMYGDRGHGIAPTSGQDLSILYRFPRKRSAMKSPVNQWKSRTMTGPVAISDPPMSVGSLETDDPAQKRWPQLRWNGSESLRVGETEFFLSIDPNTYSVPSTTDRFVLLKAKGQIDFLARHAPTNVKNIVDIGIYKGGSVVLYQELFSPKRIVGLDLTSTREDALDRYVIRRSLGETIRLYYETDQADRELLSTIISENFGEEPLDLVIDDACHLYEPTKASFNLLFPRLRPGGVYVIEDWGWAHWDDAYHQSATHNYADEKTALSKLILELVMVSASRPTMISEVHVRSAMAYLVRGSAVISPGSDIASSYLSSGRRLLND